jgi:glycosyltransferase involved in cell wall biosynthesis
MACGCPVVISDCDALVEVAGDAAEVADVGSAESLAESIESVLRDPARRDQLVERGLRRAAGFTRARMAAHTREVYEAVRELTS